MKSALGILGLSLMFSTVGNAGTSTNYTELEKLCGTRGVLTVAVANAGNIQISGMNIDEKAIKPYGTLQDDHKKLDASVKAYCDSLRVFSDACEANK